MDKNIRETVTAAIEGDRRAFDSLFARNLPRLEAFVRLRYGGATARESVCDLVQSVCREALSDLEDFEYRGEEAFRSWLFQRASHKIVDRLRYHHREKRDVRREEGSFDAPEDETRAGDGRQPAHEFTPSRHVAAQEEIARFEAMLDRLPEPQQEAIGLVRLLGISYPEAAKVMERSESSVRNLVARGLATIAGLIDGG